MLRNRKYGFAQFFEYGEVVRIGTIMVVNGKKVEVTEIRSMDFVTKSRVLVSGYGKILNKTAQAISEK